MASAAARLRGQSLYYDIHSGPHILFEKSVDARDDNSVPQIQDFNRCRLFVGYAGHTPGIPGNVLLVAYGPGPAVAMARASPSIVAFGIGNRGSTIRSGGAFAFNAGHGGPRRPRPREACPRRFRLVRLSMCTCRLSSMPRLH